MRRLIPLLLLCLVAVGCSKKAEDTPQAVAKVETPPVSDDELIQQAAAKLIDNFARTLRSELIAALADSGAAGAVRVCNVRAPQITAQIVVDPAWRIRRISQQARNLFDEADERQIEVLTKLADTSRGNKPFAGVWDRQQAGATGGREYHYYQPIYVQDMCLKCHGTTETLDPEAARVIEERYPSDRAIGYRTGDFRGAYLVSVKWPEGRQFAENILKNGRE